MERYSKVCVAGVQKALGRLLLCCRLCGMPGHGLCADCRALFPVNLPACPRCATPMPAGTSGQPCGACQRRLPPFARAWSPWRYEPPLDWLLPRLKYHQALEHARLLGSLMAEYLPEADVGWAEAIVPVPLHRARLVRRGFNQALELARPVARYAGLPLLGDAVVRVRDTPAQVGLERAARLRNLKGSFAVRRSLPSRVLLFDDVLTTGATAEALTRALLQAGVEEVRVWAVARA
ncbi:MAG: ComF family protein [Gammaproteobacteria bacterium]|nr:MAG: ComF family protein [Gammaproteobacteria bacterium]